MSAGNENGWVVSTTADTFKQDVFERSADVPVIVDFWAEWCSPCRMLAPILENLAEEFGGKFVLVKANTDDVPDAAGQFGVQSIPAVFGLCGGEVMDGFMGVLPEDEIREWINSLIAAFRVVAAKQQEESDPATAEAIYREVLAESPDSSDLQIALARVLLAQGKNDESTELIAQLERRGFLEPEGEKVKAAIELQAMSGVDVAEVQQAAEANPDDLQLQFQLAEALAGVKQYEQAFDICLALVQKNRQGVGEQGRQLMVDVFRVLPADSELVSQYRRKLSMVLY